jgi:tetratricopeptide (TPR) repeat protein
VIALGLAALVLGEGGGWKEALEARDFARAWAEVEREPLGVPRQVARAEILYRAGDPAAALDAAEEGLQHDPEQFELLFRAAGAALWLERPAAALEYVGRLERALEGPHASLRPEDAAAWRAASGSFRSRADELERHALAMRHALATSRALAVAVVGAVFALLAGVFGRGYGRSSKPVS